MTTSTRSGSGGRAALAALLALGIAAASLDLAAPLPTPGPEAAAREAAALDARQPREAERDAPEEAHQSESASDAGAPPDAAEPVVAAERPAARQTAIAGTVRSADGTPIPGASVEAVRRHGLELHAVEATSGPDGAYEILLDEPGTYSVVADHAQHRPGRRSGVGVRRGARTGAVDLVLEPGPVIEGVVRDPAGRPVAGARVEALRRGRTEARTADDGAFALAVGEDGVYRLHVSDGQHRPATLRVEVYGWSELVEVELEDGAGVAGIVTGSDGRPVEGAVVLVAQSVDGATARRRVATGPDGAYAVAGEGAGTYAITVRDDDHRPAEREVEVEDRMVVVDVALEAGLRVEVRVRDEEGAPIEGARVTASRLEDGRPTSDHRRGQTGADGVAHIAGLAAGAHRISAWSSDHMATPPVTRAVGEEDRPAVVELELRRGGVVEGVVREATSGEPLPAARVRLEAEGSDARRGSSVGADRDGAFRASGLAPGTYTVTAELPAFGRATLDGVEVRPGATATIELRIGPSDAD